MPFHNTSPPTSLATTPFRFSRCPASWGWPPARLRTASWRCCALHPVLREFPETPSSSPKLHAPRSSNGPTLPVFKSVSVWPAVLVVVHGTRCPCLRHHLLGGNPPIRTPPAPGSSAPISDPTSALLPHRSGFHYRPSPIQRTHGDLNRRGPFLQDRTLCPLPKLPRRASYW